MPHPIECSRPLALAVGALAALTLTAGVGDAAPA